MFNKIIIKNNIFKAALSASLLFLIGGCKSNNHNNNSTDVTINEVFLAEFKNDTIQYDFVKNEQVVFENVMINLLFKDNSIVSIAIDNKQFTNFSSSKEGTYTLPIEYTYENEEYTIDYTYNIHYSLNEMNYYLFVKELPYVNEIQTCDVDSVIKALNLYENLTNDEKNYIINNDFSSIEKVNYLQSYLVPIYLKEKQEQVSSLIEGLNKGKYSTENYNEIMNISNEFMFFNCSSLSEINKKYETTINNINSIEPLNNNLNEYKEKTIEYLKSLLLTNLYILEYDNNKYTIKNEPINYYNSYKNEIDNYLKPIINSQTIEQIDEGYKSVFKNIKKLYMDKFINDAFVNINNLYSSIKNMANDILSKWDRDAISLDGIYNNINTDYLLDNRWWIPEAYKISTIINETKNQLSYATNIEEINSYYNDLAVEITKATLQKNLEMTYSINRNLNKGYDTNDTIYWNYIAEYWGDTVAKQFTYNGVLTKYKNEVYGSSSSNCFRLAGSFYSPNYGETSVSSLINKYQAIINDISPEPLKIAKIEITPPEKTTFALGEEIDLSTGIITIYYNDLTSTTILMENSLFDFDSVDLTVSGSKTLLIKFIDKKTNEEKIIYLDIIIFSTEEDLNNIVFAIQNLLTKEITLELVNSIKEIKELINSLSTDSKTELINKFNKEYEEFLSVEGVVTKMYAKTYLNNISMQFETLAYYTYSSENQSKITSLYNEIKNTLGSLNTIESVDNYYIEYINKINSIEYDNSLSINEAKEKMINSLNRVCIVNFYKLKGTLNEISVSLEEILLINNELINSKYQEIVNKIKAANNNDELYMIYNNNINDLYKKVLEAYSKEATNNVKNLLFDLRNSAKCVWSNDESNDVITIKGESNSEFTTNYLDNGGYYCWYTPIAFMTGTLYELVNVDCLNSKNEIFNKYDESYFDMFRSVAYRNLMSVYFYNLSYNITSNEMMWSVLYFCSPGFEYDGCLKEYKNTKCVDNEFRLWRWGWHINDKATNLNDLIYHYNYDLTLFIGG